MTSQDTSTPDVPLTAQQYLQMTIDGLDLLPNVQAQPTKALTRYLFFEDLYLGCFSTKNTTLVYVLTPETLKDFPLIPLAVSLTLDTAAVQYTALVGTFTTDMFVTPNRTPVVYDRLVVLGPQEGASKFLAYVEDRPCAKISYAGPGRGDLTLGKFTPSESVTIRMNPKPTAYQCNQLELVSLCLDQEIDGTTKVLSCLLHCFSTCKDYGSNIVQILSYNFLKDAFPTRFRDPALTPIELSNTFNVIVISACLIPAYSRQEIVKDQLYRRYKAVMASQKSNPVDEATFGARFAELNLKCSDLASQVMDFVGMSIMLDNQYNFSLRLAKDKIVPSTTMVADAMIDSWVAPLRDQMMLVFRNKNMTTLAMAVAVRKTMENNNMSLESVFADEVNNLATIEQEISLSEFRCLSGSQELALQVNRVPHFAYLGLLYNERRLSEAEKANWKSYQVEAVGQHISSDSGRQLVKRYADYMPAPDVVDAVRLAKNMSKDFIESIVREFKESDRNLVFNALKQTNANCDWFKFELHKRQVKYQQDIKTSLTPKCKSAIANRYADLMTVVNFISDQTKRTAALNRLNQWKEDVSSLVEDEFGTVFEVADPNFPDISHLQDKYLKFVDVFSKALNNTPKIS
ncbi:MAG: hypothetical protein [brine shrimp artovirus 1]|nr:MAG: hypothetical protein [brine shrimp artovirus 1]